MSMHDNVSSKKWCSSLEYTAAARTLVAEFLSHPASTVESGLGKTCNFVRFMISNCPSAVVASGGGGGGAESGDIGLPSTTICIAGVVAAVNSMVYCSGVTNVDRSARPSAASAYALLASLSFAKTSPICSQTLSPVSFEMETCPLGWC